MNLKNSLISTLFAVVLLTCLVTSNVVAEIQVYFSPGGKCTQAITSVISGSKTSILVQAYSFTSTNIAKALVDAHKRGVKVSVILDSSNRTDKYSAADYLAHSGIVPRIDDEHTIAHNKVMVLDDRVVITGSFNFSKAAEEKNAENLLLISDPLVAAKYTANWQAHAKHSQPYKRTGKKTAGK